MSNAGAYSQLPSGSFSLDYLRHHRLFPHGVDQAGGLLISAVPPTHAMAVEDIAFALRVPIDQVEVESIDAEQLATLLDKLAATHGEGLDRTVEVERLGVDDSLSDLQADVRDLATQPPVVRYVNELVRDAYEANASDIHLEAVREDGHPALIARFRLDGVLTPAAEPPPTLATAVVSRVKLLAELDIAERRRPQDGRIRVRLESRELDIRVSTVPTMFGESVVLRLLDRGGRPVGLEELGMPSDVLDEMSRIAGRPHGMLLVTGPTGSGKTTTLYAALQRRSRGTEKIITVEDPVEYQLPGVTQVPVHRTVGVTFGAALRSILRQDPDVVMVGEMRDSETAEVAVQAAMTGHLVFSTLHTNDAVGAIPRLLDLGVPGYLVAATVDGVLAQRLVRKVCENCRATYAPSAELVAAVREEVPEDMRDIDFVHGVGCTSCRGTGYRGRIGLFEFLRMSDEIKQAVVDGVPRAQLRRLALAEGMRPLRADGWSKAQLGLTTVEEVLRVAQD